jgi:hypothetical protein
LGAVPVFAAAFVCPIAGCGPAQLGPSPIDAAKGRSAVPEPACRKQFRHVLLVCAKSAITWSPVKVFASRRAVSNCCLKREAWRRFVALSPPVL